MSAETGFAPVEVTHQHEVISILHTAIREHHRQGSGFFDDGCYSEAARHVVNSLEGHGYRLGKPSAPPYDSAADTLRHIARVRELLGIVATSFIERAAAHDRTKLEEPEKSTFDRVTPLLRGLTYGSEEYKASLADMGEALAHHYAHNSHHPEHYPDGVAGMDLFDVLEMVVDWIAAGERHELGFQMMHNPMRFERFGIGGQLGAIIANTQRVLGQS